MEFDNPNEYRFGRPAPMPDYDNLIVVLRRILSDGKPGGYGVHVRHELAVALWNKRRVVRAGRA